MESPIALIGTACRFPGNINTPEDLWNLVHSGKDAIGRIPANRGWNIADLYDPTPGSPGKFYVRDGYFLENPYSFDAGFFGISPKEAKATDPQQGIMLELAWEALERACIDPSSLCGPKSGVFIGCSPSTYYAIAGSGAAGANSENYWMTGTASSIISGRVSYTLGLEGPAMTVDTSCSSAHVALHLACQSLRLGECDLALVGGVTVLANPDPLIYFSRQRALAPDGRCKPFSADADGTSFADGAGMLVAERLSDARRLGHPILAIIKGSALSQDGASDGLTVPSVQAQVRAIRSALQKSGLNPADVDVVEAHGTGTVVGDPIEARALIAAYGRERSDDSALWVGSVKSNIGHTGAAAGTAGIIKTILSMSHGYLPKTLHLSRPTPKVDWSRGAVRLLTESVPWPEHDRPRRAGVSAFGISGTNVHVILEEPPRTAPRRPVTGRSPVFRAGGRVPPVIPFLLSAKNAAALRDQARRLADHLPGTGSPEAEMADVGRTLVTARSLFSHRAVILASTRDDLRSRLTELAAGESSRDAVVGQAGPPGKVAFVFPGQGTQWPGMAARLLSESPVFARNISDCDDALTPYVDWSLMKVLRKGVKPAEIHRADMVQPILFAIAVSLAALWRSMGVRPEAVVGHSQGETAAAHVCGALSLDAAARVSALRARALSELAGTGAMASLPISAPDTRVLLAERREEIEVASVNGPTSTVVAGAVDAIEEFIRDLADAGIEAKRLPVDYASHSAQVEPVRDAVIDALSGISASSSDIPYYSTVAGGLIDTRALDASYWWENLRRPVQLADAVTELANDGFRAFVEASPHPVLASGIQETLDQTLPAAESATVIGSLRRGRDGRDQFLYEAAKAHVAGVPVDWTGIFGRRAGVHATLPTYPFQRKPYKLDPPSPAITSSGTSTRGNPVPRFNDAGDLFFVDWVPMADHAEAVSLEQVAVIGPDAATAVLALRKPGRVVREYPTMQALLGAVRTGVPVPRMVVTSRPVTGLGPSVSVARDARATAAWALDTIQAWLDGDTFNDATLVIITRQAIACDPSAPVTGLPEATVWGLARSAQSEHPGRIGLIDLDGSASSANKVPEALTSGESQVAIRNGVIRVPRLAPAREYDPAAVLELPDSPAWRLTTAPSNSSDAMILTPETTRTRPLKPLEVRIAVRACGLAPQHKRTRPGRTAAGFEVAGVVLEAGQGVASLHSGDRVMGLAKGDIGSLAVIDSRLLSKIPEDWTFTDAAAAPAAFLTAYYALRYRARLQAGERVLIHAAAVGVSIAAVQIARLLGAEVFATADPEKWPALRAAGIPEDNIECLSPDFDNAFLWATGGAGMDVVLNLLGEQFTDSSIRVLREGGRLIEEGKAGRHPGAARDIDHHVFDVTKLPEETIGAMLEDLHRMFAHGELSPLPTLARDIRYAREAVNHIRDRHHTGKTTLTIPSRPDPEGTFLITGGTGVLGGQIARHLATRHGVRHLLLVSRRGDQAQGSRELASQLADLGAEAKFAAVDVTEPDSVRSLVSTIPNDRPLTGVIHAAAMDRDTVIENMTRERLDATLSAKVDGAWNLYQATRQSDISHFILFSSMAGILGLPGQSGYASGNSFLDSLACHLRGQGVAAVSLAWGAWETGSGMIGSAPSGHARFARNSGMLPLGSARALALLDQAIRMPHPMVAPARFGTELLRGVQDSRPAPHPLLTRLTQADGAVPSERPAAATGSPEAGMTQNASSPNDRKGLLDHVLAQVAIVLDHPDHTAFEAKRSFRDLGFDSLCSIELMQRLSASTGLKLPSRFVQEHATPVALAAALHTRIQHGVKNRPGRTRSSSIQETTAGRDHVSPPFLEIAG